MKKSISLILAALAFTSLSFAADKNKVCFFSDQIVRDGGGARMANDTSVGNGLFLYEIGGGLIIGEYHSGKSVEVVGHGPEYSTKVRHAFSVANLPKFDFQRVFSRAMKTKAKGDLAVIASSNGAIHRVFANFEGTSFDFECEHLGTDLRECSKGDTDLERLQTLFEVLEVSF